MKKIIFLFLGIIVVGTGGFYGGFLVGELNGRAETKAKDTKPLMNLLLVQAGMKKEFVEMNREQLYSNLDLFETLQSSRWITATNKQWLKQNILIARDYWIAAGGMILQSKEEALRTRQQVAQIKSASGVQMGMTINGMKVSPFYFEEEDHKVRVLFDRYSGQTSLMHDMIVGMVEKAGKKLLEESAQHP